MNIIRNGRHPLATNLFWQRVVGAGGVGAAARAQARKLPPQLGRVEHIVVRRKARQYGVSTTTNSEHKPGMYSAAAVLADAIAGSWAGIFDVPEGWYFLVCRQGHIHPETDKLFARAEKDQVRRLLEGALQDEKITAAYAPAEFNLAKTTERRIEPIFAKVGRDWRRFATTNRLAPLDQKAAAARMVMKGLPLGLGSALLIGGAPYAWEWIDEWLNPPPPRTVIHAPNPWEALPQGAEGLLHCVPALLSFPQLPGANLKKAECHRDVVVYHYVTYLDIAPALIASEKARPGCRLGPDGGKGLALQCHISAERRMGRQRLLSEQVAVDRLWRLIGATGATLQLGRPARLPLQNPAHPEQGPHGKSLPVTARMPFPPDVLASALAGLPAFTVSGVTYTTPSQWSIEGTVYVE